MESVDDLIARLKEGEDPQTQDKFQKQAELQARIELELLQKTALEAQEWEKFSYEINEGPSTYRGNLHDDPAFPTIEEYATLVEESPAYRKLLADVRCECLLAPATPNTVASVRAAIYAAIRNTDTITMAPASTVQMMFKVDWNPVHFVRRQCYQSAPETAIHDAITLTGTTSTAQAATCAQYLQQTWPVTGLEVLELVQDLFGDEGAQAASRRCWVYLGCSSPLY